MRLRKNLRKRDLQLNVLFHLASAMAVVEVEVEAAGVVEAGVVDGRDIPGHVHPAVITERAFYRNAPYLLCN
jgi:hypothetical protein